MGSNLEDIIRSTLHTKVPRSCVLPWDTANVVVVVLEVNACSTIPALHVPHVLKHWLVSPSARDDLVVIPITVNVPVLHSRVPNLHRTMHALAIFLTVWMFLLHGREEAPPAVGEYSESVLYYPTAMGESVDAYTLFHGHVPMSKRLHHPCPQGKRIIPDEVRHVTIVVW